jgi:hypothetical protein
LTPRYCYSCQYFIEPHRSLDLNPRKRPPLRRPRSRRTAAPRNVALNDDDAAVVAVIVRFHHAAARGWVVVKSRLGGCRALRSRLGGARCVVEGRRSMAYHWRKADDEGIRFRPFVPVVLRKSSPHPGRHDHLS